MVRGNQEIGVSRTSWAEADLLGNASLARLSREISSMRTDHVRAAAGRRSSKSKRIQRHVIRLEEILWRVDLASLLPRKKLSSPQLDAVRGRTVRLLEHMTDTGADSKGADSPSLTIEADVKERVYRSLTENTRVKAGRKSFSLLDLKAGMLHGPAARRRECAARLGGCLETLSETFCTLLPEPTEGSAADEDFRDAVVSSVLKRCAPLFHEFLRTKCRLLGRRTLWAFERHDLPRTRFTIDLAEALRMLHAAYLKFDGQFATALESLLRTNAIFAPTSAKARAIGAFTTQFDTGRGPYVFAPFDGTLQGALTLAHEVGHAVHLALFSREHSKVPEPDSMLLELCSVLSEQLFARELLQRVTGRVRGQLALAILQEQLNTLVRQAALSKFETRVAQTAVRNPESISALWRAEHERYLGPQVRLEPRFEFQWAMLPHLFLEARSLRNYPLAFLLSAAGTRDDSRPNRQALKELILSPSSDPFGGNAASRLRSAASFAKSPADLVRAGTETLQSTVFELSKVR